MESAKSMNYHGIVDMGSNGIRFSITDLSPPTQRILPVLYQDRIGISLYDAQYSANGTKQPIPKIVIDDVIRSLQRFKRTCSDFGVQHGNVKILATEATRAAINSVEYRTAIKDATGLEIDMLAKEDEGRVGALGVVSSFDRVKGLMMDLGGGSTQITWLICEDGEIKMSSAGSVSLPYGAAALSMRLSEAEKGKAKDVNKLKAEITKSLKDAVAKIQIPKEILDTQKTADGLTLYLSGGGFRGWGFVLMSQHHVSPYPINIINGFKAHTQEFHDTATVKLAAASALTDQDDEIFRVSNRRAEQVPAVALLVGCMMEALPTIGTVRFAQGGVREGALWMNLDDQVRAQHPLVVATSPYASNSSSRILELLKAAAPKGQSDVISEVMLTALSASQYIHNTLNKDIKAAAALRSTTTGVLAGIHGASHDDRAKLAILLCERWGGLGDLSPGDADFYQQLLRLLGPEAAWWCLFYGRVAAVIGECYPAGVIQAGEHNLRIHSSWAGKDSDTDMLSADESRFDKFFGKMKSKKDMKKESHKDKPGRRLEIVFDFEGDGNDTLMAVSVQKALKSVQKMGKKKNWLDRDCGYKIDLVIKGDQTGYMERT